MLFPCPALPCPALPCPALPCPALPCPALPYPSPPSPPPTCLAGKPALVVPCVPASDQPFWADLVVRRGLGPGPWFPVSQLSERRLAAGIDAGLRGLERFTARAEQVACEMAREDGVARVADLLEGLLPAWWQDRGASRHSC